MTQASFDDERTDEFGEPDDFEVPEEAKDQSEERQNKLKKEVYPDVFK